MEPDADGRPRHSRVLLAEVERCAEAAGGVVAVDRIAVGTEARLLHTGLRIGIATARGLAQARGCRWWGSARWRRSRTVWRGIRRRPPGDYSRCSTPGAGRFAALYERDGVEVWEPLVADPASLAGRLGELEASPLAAGEGAVRFRAELEAAGVTVAPSEDPVHRISAQDVCALGESTAEAPPDQIEPVYLRPPDAKRWLQRDRP